MAVDISILNSGQALTEGQLKQVLRDTLGLFNAVELALEGAGYVPKGEYDSGTEYSLLNTVYQQDTTWVYINETPGSGNAPPTLPTYYNDYWFLVNRGPHKAGFVFEFDAFGSVIQPGVAGFRQMPFNANITGWSLLADTTGDLVIDIWKDTFANFPPTVADTITASAKPTLSSARAAQDSTLDGWTTALEEGSVLGFNIDSASAITKAALTLNLERT